VLLEKLSDVKRRFNLLPHRLEHDHTYKAVLGAAVHSEVLPSLLYAVCCLLSAACYLLSAVCSC
jgi:hypothetical protein